MAKAVNPGTYIGSGKIQEIRALAEMEQADAILFNNTLTPMQMKNLVDALDREIIDRTALILRIFAERQVRGRRGIAGGIRKSCRGVAASRRAA